MVPEMKPETLVKSVDDLLVEKQAVLEKERELVQSLNGALRRMGYEVVPIDSGKPKPVVRRRRRRGRPPGRPRGRRRGRPSKAGRPKRRGRPPKTVRSEGEE